MAKDTMKRRIRIPYWRVDDLEAWLGGMSQKGWELEKIKNSTAIFRKTEPQHNRFYCHILEPCKEEHFEKINEDRERQIQQVAALGFVPVCGNEHIHVFRCEGACRYPILPDDEAERVVSLYKRTSGKVKSSVWAALLLLAKSASQLLYPLKMLTLPGGLIDVFLFVSMIFGLIALLIIRALTIRRIRQTYRMVFPHQRQFDLAVDSLHRRYHWLAWGRRLLYGLCIYLLFLGPITAFTMEFLLKGESPFIPAGSLPVVRVTDIQPDIDLAFSPPNPDFYQTFPSIYLPECIRMHESKEGIWIYSYKYRAFSDWYADLIALAAAKDAIGDLVERESPQKYGLDRLLYNPRPSGVYEIVAQKGSTVYYLICCNDETSNEDLFTIIGRKASD